MSKFQIEGNWYYGPPGQDIQHYLVDPQSPPIRETGAFRRSDNFKITKYIFDNWAEMGLGRKRLRRAKGEGVWGLRDAEAYTCFASQITRPLQNQDATDGPDAPNGGVQISRFAINYHGNLYLFGEGEDDTLTATARDVFIMPWDGANTTWDNTPTTPLDSGTEEIAQDAVIVQGAVVLLTAFGDDQRTYYSNVGATITGWTVPTVDITDDMLLSAVTEGENINAGVLVELGGVVYAAVWHEDQGTITMFTSADAADNWTDRAEDFSSASGPTGRCVYFDLSGTPAPIIACREGLYAWDVSNFATGDGVWQQLVSFESQLDDNNGRGLCVAEGKMFWGMGDGSVMEARYGDVNGVRGLLIRNVGPNRHDGLVSARQGYVTCLQMVVTSEFIDMAYGGDGAGKNASIFRYRLRDESWHHITKVGTANQKIDWLAASDADDSAMRLHFGVRTATTTTDERFIANHLQNPGQGGSFAMEGSGFVELAEDDMGDPHANAAVLTGRVDADNLDSTATSGDQYIEHEYGVNGAGWQNVSNFGNYVSDDKVLFFGRTNQNIDGQTEAGTSKGVSAGTIQHRLNLNGTAGSASDFEVLKEFQVEARTKLTTLNGYRCPVDVGLTARMENVNPETVLARIQTLQETVTLLSFLEYSGATTRLVEMVNHENRNISGADSPSSNQTQPGGMVWLDVQEVNG